MSSPYTLFEISWEVCNKVGGIHTVLSSKAKTILERLGDDYFCVGPWLLSDTERSIPFDDDPNQAPFTKACAAMGLPVRVGRWRIPHRPRAILIEFSSLYAKKDELLAELWEDYGVDSIAGAWDYVEPVLFGIAAGRVIEKWWEQYIDPEHRRAIVHAHEWMTGSSLLYLKKNVPALGTCFTTHATMLGRSLSSTGYSPDDGLQDSTATQLAVQHGVAAKHSIEGICAREADSFTTVSTITAKEAELLHERAPDPVTPNGIDLEVIDAIAGDHARTELRQLLNKQASAFLGQDVSDALFLATSGRYEYHNKGFDVLLDAMALLEQKAGRRVVLFVLAPAGNAGVLPEFLERRGQALAEIKGSMGLSTHKLFNPEQDPLHAQCARLGINNAKDARVLVMQVPIYLDHGDDFMGLSYEAVLSAMDLSAFPSYYEPWGYTPQESLALGVPTITTDYAGFGRWAAAAGLGAQHGISVLARVRVSHVEITQALAAELERILASDMPFASLHEVCRTTAQLSAWTGFIANYEKAYAAALGEVQKRLEAGVQKSRRPKRVLALRQHDLTDSVQEPHLIRFDVSAILPPELEGLERLARNYWWSWDPEGATLFQELSARAWEAAGHNPISFLQRVYPADLKRRSQDTEFVDKLQRVLARFDAYMAEAPEDGRWQAPIGETSVPREANPEARPGPNTEHPVAYFSAEFGIHESLRIYSGGLGILAGDHVKSASDLNLPYLAVGLFYSMGYMGQRLNTKGEQVELDVKNDPRSMPVEPVRDRAGQPLHVTLMLPGRELLLAAWMVRVGRTCLYLLDSNVEANQPKDREITRNLYGGDSETRLQQELILGRGGVRLLNALGIEASVFHMNEGHAAFLTLERVRQAVQAGRSFEEAKEWVRATTLFTTHTPVPAGHDRFGEDLMRRYFSDMPEALGLAWEDFFGLGLSKGERDSFNMTYLAMGFSSFHNGVSRLHGDASRELFRGYYPALVKNQIPLTTVTNGIHLPTWVNPRLARIFSQRADHVLPEDFDKEHSEASMQSWWTLKQELKQELFDEIKRRTTSMFLERGDSPILLEKTLGGLSKKALTIGFARRFAPYKRADLMFSDSERLRRLLDSTERPVRILVAGKAHPRDQHGKDILRSIAERARQGDLVGRVLFLEDYDIDLARFMMCGVDVWLNNPTRMLEASGTSGMKAAANGALNLSIGDGWWPEAYDGQNGWLIDQARSYKDQGLQNQLDASVLYRLLEEEVVPDFFDRDADGFPTRWLQRAACCLRSVPRMFNTDRMVSEYTYAAYRPLAGRFHAFREDPASLGACVQEKQRLVRGFKDLKISSASVGDLSQLQVGDCLEVRVQLSLGQLQAEDVLVELVTGHVASGSELTNTSTISLAPSGPRGGAEQGFEGCYTLEHSGSFSYGIRVRSRDTEQHDLVLWV